MKKNLKFIKIGLLILSLALIFTACTNKKTEDKQSIKNEEKVKESKVIKIGCMPITEPIVTFLAEGLKSKGYNIEPVVFDGNHLPAMALKEGSVDGIILNHLVWLNTFNKENNCDLTMPEPYMYYFRNAVYSSKYNNLIDIPNGATIAVPGDPSNLDRSLRILEEIKFIELGKKSGEFYNKADIEENIKNIEILETEITATVRSIEDVDAIISGANSVRDAGYDHTKYLYDDPTNEDFPLGLIVKDEDKSLNWVKAILEYQQNEEFKEKFNKRYDYTYVLFQ